MGPAAESNPQQAASINLSNLIQRLHEIFSSDNVNVEQVHALMESYKSNPEEWKKFAKFDEHRLTRNLVDEGNGKFDLILVCWEGGHSSSLHDHADSHCFMRVLEGELNEIRFDWPNSSENDPSNTVCKDMKENSRIKLETGSVSYMSDLLGLHRVENGSKFERAISLHLYSPPIASCLMFDQKTGNRSTCQITFWSKYGEKA